MAVARCWEIALGLPSGRVHKSVAQSFMPFKIMFPLYQMTHLFLLNVTSHLASVNTHIANNETIDRAGIM
jgi:hypothetical protein